MPDSLPLSAIAAMAGRSARTVEGWVLRYPDFPPAGRRTERAVRDWLAAHPRVAGPPSRPVPAGDPDERVQLAAYSLASGRSRTTLHQYARRAAAAGWPDPPNRDWFPRRGDDGRYRLGDLVDWDRSRPGQGA